MCKHTNNELASLQQATSFRTKHTSLVASATRAHSIREAPKSRANLGNPAVHEAAQLRERDFEKATPSRSTQLTMWHTRAAREPPAARVPQAHPEPLAAQPWPRPRLPPAPFAIPNGDRTNPDPRGAPNPRNRGRARA